MENLIQACETQQARFNEFQAACDKRLCLSQRLINKSRSLIAETKDVIARLQEFS